MILRQMILFGEQEDEPVMLYQGGSHASRTAKQESVKHLLMSVTYGPRCGELLAKFDQRGSLVKMYGGYCQAKLDGSFEEFSEIFPTWGMLSDGAVYELPKLEPFTIENGLELLPTPVAADTWVMSLKSTEWTGHNKHSMTLIQALANGKEDATYLNPNYCELLMGFPIGWTELNALEMR